MNFRLKAFNIIFELMGLFESKVDLETIQAVNSLPIINY